MKVKVKGSGVSSSISEEVEAEVETTTADSLGKFNVIKMDIERTKCEVIKESAKWLDYFR